MRPFYARQMAQYAAFHADHRNRATHMIGVPAIIAAIVIGTVAIDLPFGLSLADLLVVAALCLWLWLDVAVGLAIGALLLPVLWFAHWLLAAAPWRVLPLFLLLFVGGWALQLLGHVFEGKRPAFLSNLFQTLIAPMFLMDELFRGLGLRRAPLDRAGR